MFSGSVAVAGAKVVAEPAEGAAAFAKLKVVELEARTGRAPRLDKLSKDEKDKEKVLEPDGAVVEPCLLELAPDYRKDPRVVEAVRSGLLKPKDFALDEGDSDSGGDVDGEEEEEYWSAGDYWDK